MNAIDKYRQKLAEKAVEAMNILGTIADAEKRIKAVKDEVVQIYEQIDDALDKDKT